MKKRSNLKLSTDYTNWLAELKTRVRQSQLKAVVAVNQELLKFYWELGSDIVEKQKSSAWGTGFLKQLSRDLITEFPDMKGFSERNLKYVRQWFLFYSESASIGQQPVAQLRQQTVTGANTGGRTGFLSRSAVLSYTTALLYYCGIEDRRLRT